MRIRPPRRQRCRAIVSSLIEQNAQGAQGNATDGGARPASLPSRPIAPNRRRVIGNGLGAGLVLGLVCGAVFSIVRRKERWSFKRIGAFAAGGIALGLTVAFLIPDEFVSTAVLRTTDIGKLQSTVAEVLSDDSLAAIVRQDDLFSRELSNGNMNDVTRKMRNRVHPRAASARQAGRRRHCPQLPVPRSLQGASGDTRSGERDSS
jgi:hypothetical protein